MNSCLYEARVFHRRLVPRCHEFIYRVFWFCLDLDELPSLRDRWPGLLGIESPGIYSFRSADHWGKKGTCDLRKNVEDALAERGIGRPARILLLGNLRVLGYVFNPIAIYFCFDAQGKPTAAIAQVGNTFGEQKLYFVPPDRKNPDRLVARLPKEFYVSPFSDLDFSFEFRLHLPGERLQIYVDEYRGDERILISSLTGSRRSLTASRLAAWFFLYPLPTLRVIFLIHWQALRLWAKRIPWHRKQANPDMQKDILNPLPHLKTHR